MKKTPQLPDGARLLPLPQVGQTGGTGQVRDIASSFWFSPLQPVKPTAPPDTRVRTWNFQPGANIVWTPGSEDTPQAGFWVLREIADSWDLLRLVIETVKDRLCERELDFKLVRDEGETVKDLKARTDTDPRIKKLKAFFKCPDGIHPWREWIRMWLEDILVCDAGAIYLERDVKGRIASLRVIDGTTISRVIDDRGVTPQDEGSTAYQQILYGLPAIDLTTDDLVYTMRNPRTWKRYGYSPVEQIVVSISIGLRKQQFDLKYFTAGNIPEALVFLPPDMELDQVKETQDWFDGLLAGNLGKRRQLTFLPGYGSPKEQAFRPNVVFTKENALKTPMDEWLFSIVAYAFGTTPGGLIKSMNRATAQQSAESSEEEGLEPKSRTIEDMITSIVQQKFGFEDIEASFEERRDVDPEKQMTVDTGYLKVGGITLNQLKENKGEDPYDSELYPEADEPLIYTANGPVTLRMAINAAKQSMLNAGSSDEGDGEVPAPQEPPPPEPAAANGNGKPKAKPAKKALAVASAPPSIDPTYETPALRGARVNLENALKRVFRRQKERAAQAANELLKKKLLTTKELTMGLKKWLAVDFDRTLATAVDHTDPSAVGDPIPKVVELVKDRLAAGEEVRVFTARVWTDGTPEKDNYADKARAAIQAWCVEHLGVALPVTNEKGPGMTEIIDDLATNPADIEKLSKFSHCSVQASAPQLDSSFIADEDLAGKGREQHSHVTVKYGVNHQPEQLASILANFQPFDVTLSSVFAFDPTENSDWTAPIVVEVDAAELYQLHDLIGASIGVKPDTFPYTPHLTLAYVKPEAALKYEGISDFDGVTFTVSAVELTDLDGNVMEVPLGGGALKVRKAADDEADSFFNQLDDLMKQEWLGLPAQVRQDLLESFTAGVDKGLSDLDLKSSTIIGKVNTVAQEWAADRAAELVGMKYDADGQLVENPDARWAISDTTRSQLRDIVTSAFEDETKLSELEADIKEAGAFSDSRAKMIARTEASKAMVSGNYEVWAQSGIVIRLRWLMSDDHDQDDECDLNDGEEVEFGEAFPSGDTAPPIHPNCACGVVAVGIEGVSS